MQLANEVLEAACGRLARCGIREKRCLFDSKLAFFLATIWLLQLPNEVLDATFGRLARYAFHEKIRFVSMENVLIFLATFWLLPPQ